MNRIAKINDEWHVSKCAGHTQADLRQLCCDALDYAYRNLVECPLLNEENRLRFAASVFNAGPTTAPEVITARYERLVGLVTVFETILMQPEVGILINPDSVWKPTTIDRKLHETIHDRVCRVMAALDNLYGIVFHTNRHRYTKNLAHPVPRKRKAFSQKAEPKDTHYLQAYMYQQLFRDGAHLFKGNVMVPVYTDAGHFTRTYRVKCELSELFRNYDLSRYEDMYLTATVSKRNRELIISNIEDINDPRAPILERERTMFSYSNGILYGMTGTFEPYSATDWAPHHMEGYGDPRSEHREELRMSVRDYEQYGITRYDDALNAAAEDDDDSDVDEEPEEEPDPEPSTTMSSTASTKQTFSGDMLFDDLGNNRKAAAQYFPVEFPIDVLSKADPLDVPTPTFDSIFRRQGYFDMTDWRRIMLYVYGAGFGRLLYPARIEDGGDNWQIATFLKGMASTGKGVSLTTMRKMYQSTDIGILSNQAEKTFGLEGLKDAWMVLCMELDENFTLPQAVLQSIISAEDVVVARKHRVALQIIWNSSLIMAGNITGRWKDTGGSLSRRMLVIPFPKIVPRKEIDASMPQKMEKELPYIQYKIIRCYLKVREEVRQNGNSFWNTCPQFFRDEKEKLSSEINTLDQFLSNSGHCELAKRDQRPAGEYQWDFNHFKKQYKIWCNDTSAEVLNMSRKDHYDGTFQKHGIYLKFTSVQDSSGATSANTQWLFGVRNSAAAQMAAVAND
jgi:hypothetical protein